MLELNNNGTYVNLYDFGILVPAGIAWWKSSTYLGSKGEFAYYSVILSNGSGFIGLCIWSFGLTFVIQCPAWLASFLGRSIEETALLTFYVFYTSDPFIWIPALPPEILDEMTLIFSLGFFFIPIYGK